MCVLYNLFKITYIEEVEDNEALLDKKAGHWPQNVSDGMFDLSTECRKKKQERPDTSSLIAKLELFLV